MEIRGGKMTVQLQVVGIGDKSINLLGDKKNEYLSLANSKKYNTKAGEELIIRFNTEGEQLSFLQNLIDKGVPFFETFYPDGYSAYFFAKEFIKDDKLKGNLIKSIWKNGEYEVIADNKQG